jgi:hypothetical protein
VARWVAANYTLVRETTRHNDLKVAQPINRERSDLLHLQH